MKKKELEQNKRHRKQYYTLHIMIKLLNWKPIVNSTLTFLPTQTELAVL